MNKTALRCIEIARQMERQLSKKAQKLRDQGAWFNDIAYVVDTRAATCDWVAQAIRKEFAPKGRKESK